MNIAKKLCFQLLIYSTLRMCESSALKTTPYHKSKTFNYQQNENCICYVNNEKLPLVSEMLDSTYFGFERLVVYFYKDLYTQNIAMYIPNSVKQNLIPDLPFESGDNFMYPKLTETIHNVVNMSPQKLLINVEPSLTFENSISGSTDDKSITKGPIDWNNEIVEVDGQLVNITSTGDNIFYDPGGVQAAIITQEEISNYLPVVSSETTNVLSDEMVNLDLNNVENIKESVISTSDGSYEITSNNNPLISENKGNFILLDSNIVFKPENISNKNKSSALYLQNFQDHENMNKWIEQQMLNYRINGNLKSIDVEALRMLILETLLENKITITSDGVLMDSWGTVLDSSNLILRPVLLDNSVGYDHVLQNFLEALMISQTNPPRVLGIIPLQKTYLPNPMRYSMRHDKKLAPSSSSTISKVNCLNGRCSSVASENSLSLDSPRLDNRIIPGTLRPGEISTPKGMNNFVYKAPVVETAPNVEYYLKGDYSTPNIIKDDGEVQQNMIQFPNVGSILDTITKFVKTRKQPDGLEVEGNESNSNTEEEGPGIRIIGGSAATGSGTPVSSKGRAGTLFHNGKLMW